MNEENIVLVRISRIMVAVGLFSIDFLVEFQDEEGAFHGGMVNMHLMHGCICEKEVNTRWLGYRSEGFGIVFTRDLCESPSNKARLENRIGSFREFDFINKFGADNVCVGGLRDNGESAILEVCCHLTILRFLP